MKGIISTKPIIDMLDKNNIAYTEFVAKAAAETVQETAQAALEKMIDKVEPHRKTGEALATLGVKETSQGNYYGAEVGMVNYNSSNKDGLHLIYQEYGTPTTSADPFFAPAMEEAQKDLTAIMRKKLKEMGQAK